MLFAVVLNLISASALGGAWALAVWDLRRSSRGAEGGRGDVEPPDTRGAYTLAA